MKESWARGNMRFLAALSGKQFIAVLLLCGFGLCTGADIITFESLLNEMVDRESIARFPEPSYTCRQFSSYDRDSVGPDKEGWFANWDRSQFVRVEDNNGRKEYVLMDAEGAGAVVRFWGTWHGPAGGKFSNGIMRIYLDGKSEPAVEGLIRDIISGGKLVGAPLSQGVSPQTNIERQGHNLYLPIPYANGCKITYESDKITDFGAKEGEALYYQINYRTYEEGTKVESFSIDVLERAKPLVEKVQEQLTNRSRGIPTGTTAEKLSARLGPGEKKQIALKGPAAIRELSFTLKADDIEQALRSMVVDIEFDGEKTVWCPAGDFFGTGHKINKYSSWYTQVGEDGRLSCWWVMPFRKDAKVTLRNVCKKQTVSIEGGQIVLGKWDWDEQSMYFHADWRNYPAVDTQGDKDMTGNRAFDVNYIKVAGKGVYAGDTLTVFNGIAAWWGEGDEKIFVDGEKFPSHIGTGTEDYYGYAWCRPEYFEAPFHAQPNGGGNLAGGFSVNSRYRSLDAIPFSHSLKFDMELWHWGDTKINYAPATFWYALGDAESNTERDIEQCRKLLPRTIEDIDPPKKVEGAIEGESLKIVSVTGGSTQVQSVSQFKWSNNRQLWWIDGKSGDKMTLELPVEEEGVYEIKMNLTKAIDYGIVRLYLNEKELGEAIDLYNDGVITTGPLSFGKFELKKGVNELIVEIVGANDKAVKRHMFGLDYILLNKP
jgi:hypothetical protein